MHLRAGHASFLGSTVGRQPHREIGGTDCAAGHGYCRARGIIAKSQAVCFWATWKVMPTPLRDDELVCPSGSYTVLPRLIAIVGS
jgi:hypothetical protein